MCGQLSAYPGVNGILMYLKMHVICQTFLASANVKALVGFDAPTVQCCKMSCYFSLLTKIKYSLVLKSEYNHFAHSPAYGLPTSSTTFISAISWAKMEYNRLTVDVIGINKIAIHHFRLKASAKPLTAYWQW